MTIQQAIEKAIEGGLREGEKWKFVSANRYWAVWLDGNGTETTIAMEMYFMSPLFWQSLYGSEKYGRIKAIEFINAIFDGKSAEKFFEQESDLGKEQQEKALS